MAADTYARDGGPADPFSPHLRPEAVIATENADPAAEDRALAMQTTASGTEKEAFETEQERPAGNAEHIHRHIHPAEKTEEHAIDG